MLTKFLLAASVLFATAASARATPANRMDELRELRADAQAARTAIARNELKMARRHVNEAMKIDGKLGRHDRVGERVRRDLVVARASLDGHKPARADHALALVENEIDVR